MSGRDGLDDAGEVEADRPDDRRTVWRRFARWWTNDTDRGSGCWDACCLAEVLLPGVVIIIAVAGVAAVAVESTHA